MQLLKDKLIQKLARVNNYLSSQQHREPDFTNLIGELTAIIDNIKRKKITIKISGQTPNLAQTVKNSFDRDKNSVYQFPIIAAEKPVAEIIKYCELICFVYDVRQSISEADRLLMEAASEANVDRAILVINSELDNNSESLATWMAKQPESLTGILLPLNKFFNPNSTTDLAIYDLFLERQSLVWIDRFEERIEHHIRHKIQRYFASAKKSIWQEMQQYKNINTQGEPPDTFKKKLDRSIQKISKQQQQTFRKIKQLVNQSKADLTNCFKTDSLMFEIQIAIQEAEVKIIDDKKQSYLYLIAKDRKYSEKLYLYLAEVLQQNLDDWLAKEWQKIEEFYDQGGLNELSAQIAIEPNIISVLCPQTIKLVSIARNSFKLADFVELSVLEDNSRISFDYSFTQSSWFRLLISVGVGLVIFIATKLIFGTGKYFGFVILFFQVINLLTGQDIKKIKLKQQSKELKRMVDSKYQLLLRMLTDRIVQDLIIILDDQHYYYQQQIDNIVQIVDEKLLEVKSFIQQRKDNLNDSQLRPYGNFIIIRIKNCLFEIYFLEQLLL